MLYLKVALLVVLALAALVAVVVAVIYLHQGFQLLRFRWSMRSFAKNDAEADDPALEIPKVKGTREEELEREQAVWALFYRSGLSVAKLRASDRLRTHFAFTKPEWIRWEEWRGWHRLATQGSEAVRKRARDHARREAEGNLGAFPLRNLQLCLELYDEKERPALAMRWAQRNIGGDDRRGALRVLEDLASRNDAIAASALYELFQHYCDKSTSAKAFVYAKRYFEQPTKTLDNVIRRSLRQLFTPELDEPVNFVSRWGIYGSKRAHLVVTVYALDVKAAPEVWLDNPGEPINRASRGDKLWEHPIAPSKFPFLKKITRFFELPSPIEGPVHVEVSAQFPPPRGWSDCMGDEAMPITKRYERVPNTSLEAVLSLTENSVSMWVVDKKTKAPEKNVSLTLMRRDDRGKIETQSSTTDEKGLFTWSGKVSWQFGVLVERANSQGRQEQLFLTNSSDITTSKAPVPLRRFYVMLARPLYRPGERVQGKLFARQKGHEGASKKLGASLNFQLEVYAPRGLKIASVNCVLNEFGTATFDFQVPHDAPLGRYVFKLARVSDALEGSFHVEEFVAPEFRAELRAKDKPTWGRKCALEFEATYFFGGPVANARGTLEIKRANWRYRNVAPGSFSKWFRRPKHIASMPFKTDAQGRATIDFSWKGPWDLLRRFDGCDFDFVATVRDASGKSCQATLHLSIPRVSVIVSAKPVRSLRLPGETLLLALHWEPADAADDTPRRMTLTCRKGRTKKTFVHEVRRSQSELEIPLDLPAGRWEISAHLEKQTPRARATAPFTLLGPEIEQKTRELVVSNDPTDNQGTIRVALMGPKTYCAQELLVWNRGPRLGSKVIDRSSPTAWVELPYIAGKEEQVHLSLWYFDAIDPGLHQLQASAEINAPSIDTEAPVDLSLAFPAETLRPGAETLLEAKLSAAPEKPGELTVTVIDEAIFSLVPAPKSPLSFFEDAPPRPQAFAAWSVLSAQAQRGREVYPHHSYDHLPNNMPGSPTLAGGAFHEARSMDMHIPAAAMAMPMAPRKSASPLRAAAAVAAAPVALVGAGAELVSGAMRDRLGKSASAELERQDSAAGTEASAPVQLRSDFSSEAAWIPNARFARRNALTLPIKLPDSLTTWKASAILVSLAHDHLLEAHARVRTQKPLMVRLQAPRFFQERDVLALRAMLDARSEQALSVQASLEARGFELGEDARIIREIEPNGQARIDVELTVPTCQTQEVVVRAQAVATNAPDASDAEERTVPYRPYGMLLRKTLSGVIAEESTSVSFELPTQRIKEFTALSIQIDRGPLDAVIHALGYLREYPYGCVEQTCSRLLPHLLWERLHAQKDEPSSVYRSARSKMPEDVVQETLRRITSMQNGNGGFGWWPGGKSDLWMTAYVVFTHSIASQPESQSLQRARAYLTKHLLERDHSDDADAFAAFALAWTDECVADRVLEVLTSRWDGLSLTEKAKVCWVLAVQGHERAAECAEEVKKALVGPAKRFLKKVAREEDEYELQWFHPGSTEAIAFFVLALLRERQGKRQHLSSDDETLEVLVTFLLQHRKGKRWHNTRDTALAVLALLTYEEALRGMGPDRKVVVHINAEKKHTATLERLGAEPIAMQFGDDDLRPGANELSFVVDESPAGGKLAHRHFSAELEYYTQEAEIAATGEGIEVERSYWLLDEKKEPKKQLRNGDTIAIGQRIRVVLKLEAAKLRTYLLLEDRKLAGCEPVAKKSGRDVCTGHCAHVELRADRTAIFFDVLGTERHEVSYDIEAVLPGRFTAMPARIETMYEARCFATSSSFSLVVEEQP